MITSIAADARSVLLLERALTSGYAVASMKQEEWFIVKLQRERGKPYVGTGLTFPEALNEALKLTPDCLWIAGNLPDDYDQAASFVRPVRTAVITEAERAA
jgi:hypothetical protein